MINIQRFVKDHIASLLKRNSCTVTAVSIGMDSGSISRSGFYKIPELVFLKCEAERSHNKSLISPDTLLLVLL